MRTQFWQFDQAANSESATAPANGFGQVTPPGFGNVDLSTNIPSDRFTASSGLKTRYLGRSFRADMTAWKGHPTKMILG